MPLAPAWRHQTVVTADGARLAVFVAEPTATSETRRPGTVVMAHGWTLDHRSWDRVAQRLVDNGWRVVAWDQRGHGQSTLKNGRNRVGGESVRALGADLRTVIQETTADGEKLVLAGHSMGGMTVMALAGLDPDFFTSRVQGSVLVATSAGDLHGPNVRGLERSTAILGYVPLRLGPVLRFANSRVVGFGPGAQPEDVEATRHQIGHTRLSSVATFYTALAAHDEVAALAHLGTRPVRILVGTKDKLTPVRHAKALAAAMPEGTLTILDKAGHMLPYERVDEVCDAIENMASKA